MGTSVSATKTIPALIEETIGRGNAADIVERYSNLGSSNPYKGPTAKSLFYEAGKRTPGKYGQFLLYSFGSYSNDFINAYYRSESSEYNLSISSLASKNPSASFLVNETSSNELIFNQNNGTLGGIVSNTAYSGSIVGGLAAPYYWKDFLYCKYYGTIPNNYMITLRRFPTPILDNLSIPQAVKDTTKFSAEGAGRPVAQAVTWYGGNTGNSLKELISFGSGITWDPKPQEVQKTQEALAKGFFQDAPANAFGNLLGNISSTAKDVFGDLGVFIETAAIAADPQETSTTAIRTKGLRDIAKERGGVMGEYIWVPVDVVKNTYIRGIGLTFTSSTMKVVFEYDLASVGEVNSKAAMLDIMGNLLAIGTNYGNFLTPEIRYNSTFSPIGFPGGNAGLELYYSDPLAWFIKFGKEISKLPNTVSEGDGGSTDGILQELALIEKNSGNDPKKIAAGLQDVIKKYGSAAVGRVTRNAVVIDFLEKYQAPVSFLTGAPVGEWHLTIGNPCNPIAMIGNLICENVQIEFSESLGPDDFPTSIKATFDLKHARDRERGEIESMFNRGDGRLYQTVQSTSASAQSIGAVGDVNGNILSEETRENYLNGNLWQRDILSNL